MTRKVALLGDGLAASQVRMQLEDAGFDVVGEAGGAGVVLTYYPAMTLLEDAYFGEDGLIKRAQHGTVFIDLSPTTPSFSREVSAVAMVNDFAFVEAPLVVCDPLGPLEFTCYAASDEPESIENVRDVLESIASSVEITGAAGSAQLAKAADTVRMTAVLVGAVEAEALMRASSGSLAPEEEFEGGFHAELALADIAAAMMAADDVELILPQLEAAMHLFELLVVIGGATMNPQALSLLYREEQASAAQGLDWTRAEGLYAGDGDECGCAHDHDHDHGSGDSYDGDGFGFAGGFGGYSAN